MIQIAAPNGEQVTQKSFLIDFYLLLSASKFVRLVKTDRSSLVHFSHPMFVGIYATELNDKDGRFVDLYQRLQLKNLLPTNTVYDYNCPSVQDELQKRTCPVCFLYHSSAAAMKRHKRLHSSKYLKEEQTSLLRRKECPNIPSDISDGEEENRRNRASPNRMSGAPLIENIFDFLASDFAEI